MPTIAATVRSGAAGAIAAAQSRAFEIGLGLALPAATAFALLAQPIAAGLFERGAFDARDTAAVAAALAAICAGLPGHVLEKVLGAVSFAHEDARTPMLAALAGLAAALAGALVLFPRYGHVGVAAAIAISGWVGATLLGAILLAPRLARVDRAAAAAAAADHALATVVMGVGAGRRANVARLDARPALDRGRIAALMLLVGSASSSISPACSCSAWRGCATCIAAIRHEHVALASCRAVMRCGPAQSAREQPWPSRSACFPGCSRPATCISATISAPS
jgi:putative peptidoglycan lipid II flippase